MATTKRREVLIGDAAMAGADPTLLARFDVVFDATASAAVEAVVRRHLATRVPLNDLAVVAAEPVDGGPAGVRVTYSRAELRAYLAARYPEIAVHAGMRPKDGTNRFWLWVELRSGAGRLSSVEALWRVVPSADA